MTSTVLMVARVVLRGVLPYPDLMRRVRVRRSAYALATHDPWPRSEAAATGSDYARLALLRLLSLQRDTRRAVQTRQRESAAQLARTAVETCIFGLWFLYVPGAIEKVRGNEIKLLPALLTFLSHTGMVPDALIRQAVAALGEQQKLPAIRTMTEQIDSKTGAKLAIVLYDMAYRPASTFFSHATSSALMRHVTTDYRYARKPAKVWFRRTPARLVDSCVGLLAGAIANSVAAPTELFYRYTTGHAERVLPPLLVTVGRGMARQFGVTDVVFMWKETQAVRAYLSRGGASAVPGEREARVRSMYETLLARLDLDDVPSEAFAPIVDFFVSKVLSEWETERESLPTEQSQTIGPYEV